MGNVWLKGYKLLFRKLWNASSLELKRLSGFIDGQCDMHQRSCLECHWDCLWVICEWLLSQFLGKFIASTF